MSYNESNQNEEYSLFSQKMKNMRNVIEVAKNLLLPSQALKVEVINTDKLIQNFDRTMSRLLRPTNT